MLLLSVIIVLILMLSLICKVKDYINIYKSIFLNIQKYRNDDNYIFLQYKYMSNLLDHLTVEYYKEYCYHKFYIYNLGPIMRLYYKGVETTIVPDSKLSAILFSIKLIFSKKNALTLCERYGW